jgi:hypothetical protein
MGWTIWVLGFDSRWGLRIFLFITMSRMVLGPTQPPIQWMPGSLSLGVKWLRHEADHSPPSSAEVKNASSYISTPQYIFMASCLVKHRDNITFTFYPSDDLHTSQNEENVRQVQQAECSNYCQRVESRFLCSVRI